MKLDSATLNFFEEWSTKAVELDKGTLFVGGAPIMFSWELPVMREFAERLDVTGRSLLEIGFGMGVASDCFQQMAPASHTILEPHPGIYRNALDWRSRQAGQITVINDFWQNQVEHLTDFNAVFYDSCNAPGSAHSDRVAFFEIAASRLLAQGGKLGFWHKGDSLPSDYQTAIAQNFEILELTWVHELEPSYEAQVLGFGRSMVVPVAWNRDPQPKVSTRLNHMYTKK